MSKIFKAFLAVVAIGIAILGAMGGIETSQKVKYPTAYSDYIIKYANKNGLDPYLVMAVVKVESNFVPEASSHVAHGLMQLTEETAAWTANDMKLDGDYDFTDSETSIKLGCHYLKHLINIYGNIDTALAAYNGGMGNVNKWLKNPDYSKDGISLDYIPFPETRAYVNKVNEYWDKYKNSVTEENK